MIEITDAYINKLFEKCDFGEAVNSSVKEKRKILRITLENQLQGYWSGDTAHGIAVMGGFLVNDRRTDKKRLTLLGRIFMGLDHD